MSVHWSTSFRYRITAECCAPSTFSILVGVVSRVCLDPFLWLRFIQAYFLSTPLVHIFISEIVWRYRATYWWLQQVLSSLCCRTGSLGCFWACALPNESCPDIGRWFFKEARDRRVLECRGFSAKCSNSWQCFRSLVIMLSPKDLRSSLPSIFRLSTKDMTSEYHSDPTHTCVMKIIRTDK